MDDFSEAMRREQDDGFRGRQQPPPPNAETHARRLRRDNRGVHGSAYQREPPAEGATRTAMQCPAVEVRACGSGAESGAVLGGTPGARPAPDRVLPGGAEARRPVLRPSPASTGSRSPGQRSHILLLMGRRGHLHGRALRERAACHLTYKPLPGRHRVVGPFPRIANLPLLRTCLGMDRSLPSSLHRRASLPPTSADLLERAAPGRREPPTPREPASEASYLQPL